MLEPFALLAQQFPGVQQSSPAQTAVVISLAVLCNVVALGHMLTRPELSARSRLQWALAILLLPFLGACFYAIGRHAYEPTVEAKGRDLNAIDKQNV